MRYLAIDFGGRRIGLAVSDESETLATPHSTRQREGTRRDVAAIVEVVRGLGAAGVVFGLPRALSGGPGEGEEAARAFAAQLQQGLRAANLPIEIAWWDERFSTREALGQMRDAGISQKRGRDANDGSSTDARAAAVILQGFLDSRKMAADGATFDSSRHSVSDGEAKPDSIGRGEDDG
jgi:putative Holliday junction resolvase